MGKKQYEQFLIQDLAKRSENYYRKLMKTTNKDNFFSLTAYGHEIKGILEEEMGIKVCELAQGKFKYVKRGKVRHKRNFKKRK